MALHLIGPTPFYEKLLRRGAFLSNWNLQTYSSIDSFSVPRDGSEWGGVILDADPQGLGTLNAINHLRTKAPWLPVIFLNGSAEVVDALRAIRSGSYDCLPVSIENEKVVPWVKETVERHWFSGLRKRLIKDGLERTRQLTTREKDILVMVVAGRNNREIAVHYEVSLRTVANHRANILRKTGSRNTADLVRIVTVAFMTELSECV